MAAAVAFVYMPAVEAKDKVPIPRISPLVHPSADNPMDLAAPSGDDSSGDATDDGSGDAAAVDFGDGSGDTDSSFGEPDVPSDSADVIPAVEAPEPLTDLSAVSVGDAVDLTSPGDSAPSGDYVMEARLTADGRALTSGMTWAIFGETPGSDGHLPLIKMIKGGSVDVRIATGSYLVHAGFGRAGVTKRITVAEGRSGGNFVLNAGGLRLSAVLKGDLPIAPSDLSFQVYAPDAGATEERVLLVASAPPNRVLRLNAGIYHVVCHYGEANAVVRADIRVQPGKLTDAAIVQQAARITLKLVEQHGGEALADTTWSVMTPAGETITDSVGAFPSVILGVGDYTAVAKHDGNTFERNFTVEAGLNRDVEVLVK